MAQITLKQEELLRLLSLQSGPAAMGALDGRTLNALERRGLVERIQGTVVVTPEGTEYFNTRLRRRRRVGVRLRGLEQTPRHAILEAVETLKIALPTNSKLSVGELRVSGEELIDSLMRYAEGLELDHGS